MGARRKGIASFVALALGVLMLMSACAKQGNAPGGGGSSAPAAGEDVIRIGMTAPLTGSAAESGISWRQGAELAVDEINSAGGVTVGGKKYKIRFLIEDEQGKPDAGVAAAEKLITRDKVHYLIGDAYLSSVTMAIMELAPKYNIPIVSGEAVSAEISKKIKAETQKYAYFWKGSYSTPAYADAVFSTVKTLVDDGQYKPKANKVVFIVEDTDSGRSNVDQIGGLFKNAGWTVTAEILPASATEFYPQLGKLRESGAGVVISNFASLAPGVAIAKQFREQGVDILHVAITYPFRPEFVQQVGSAADGIVWVPLGFEPDLLKDQKAFADQVKAKYKTSANFSLAFGYDSIQNAADAISRAGSLEPAAIIKAIAAIDRKGVRGRYQYDQSNHEIKAGPDNLPVLAAQIQKGKNQIVFPAQYATAKYEKQPWIK